jgi:hypothetical protein
MENTPKSASSSSSIDRFCLTKMMNLKNHAVKSSMGNTDSEATFFFFFLFQLDDSTPKADDNWRSWRSHHQRDKPTADACWFYIVNLQAH